MRFLKEYLPFTYSSLRIENMSAGQLHVLRKISLLRLTALMERYSMQSRSSWHWYGAVNEMYFDNSCIAEVVRCMVCVALWDLGVFASDREGL